MSRPKMHGGYTSTPEDGGVQTVVYWTCEHSLTLPASTPPHIACPKCILMTDSELEAFIKAKNLQIETFADSEDAA